MRQSKSVVREQRQLLKSARRAAKNADLYQGNESISKLRASFEMMPKEQVDRFKHMLRVWKQAQKIVNQ